MLSVPFEGRGKRMDECLQLVKALWTDEFVNFQGEFYQAVDWTCNPKPVQEGGIPIWLGGGSKGQLRRIGKYADGWLATPLSMATLDDDFAIAKEAAVAAGRDPAALTLTIESAGVLTPDGLEQTAESLSKLKERGVFHAILGVHPRHMADANELIENFAAKHLPALQA